MSNQRNPQAGSWKRVRAIAVLFAAALLIATACGSDSDASDAQDWIGSWSSDDGVTMEVGEGSILTTGGPCNGCEASITVTGDTVEWTDLSGDNACRADQVGTYEWSIVDDVLTLTLVSEDCEGRGIGLDGRTMTRG